VVDPSIWIGLPSQLHIFPRALSPAFFTLRLLFLAVLESGAPLRSSLEEALYKCSILMNEQKLIGAIDERPLYTDHTILLLLLLLFIAHLNKKNLVQKCLTKESLVIINLE